MIVEGSVTLSKKSNQVGGLLIRGGFFFFGPIWRRGVLRRSRYDVDTTRYANMETKRTEKTMSQAVAQLSAD